jgi:hypothetical protein
MDTLLPGISAERMPASRLTVNVLSVTGRATGGRYREEQRPAAERPRTCAAG